MTVEENAKRRHRKFEQILAPVILNFGVASYLAGLDEQSIHWEHQTYVPKEKYTVDYVGLREDGSLLHLEQETSGISAMRQRMLEYATALAITSKFQRRIHQVVYYTGDAPYRPDFLATELGALFNWFKVVDAGDSGTAFSILRQSFPGAALSLLARDNHASAQAMFNLIDRIKAEHPSRQQELLVLCRSIASLRGRQDQWDLQFMRNWDHLTKEDFVNPGDNAFTRKAQLKALSLILNHELSFTISDELRDYLYERADHVQLEDFLEHATKLTSQDELMDLIGVNVVTSSTPSHGG